MGLFIDLKKAFDTVDNEYCFTKLHFYDMCGVLGKYVRSYLSNCSQFVLLGVTVSHKNIINVPQGLGLGPILIQNRFIECFR